VHELSNVGFVRGLDTFPSGGLFIEVSLGIISVSGGSVSEVFLVSDIGIDDVESGVVGINSGLGFIDSLLGDFHEVVVGLNLLSVDSVHLSSGFVEVELEFLEKSENFLDGFTVGEILGHLNENLGDMAPFGGDGEFFD